MPSGGDSERVAVRGLSARVAEYGERGEAIFADARKAASDAHDAGPVTGKSPALEGMTSGVVRAVPGLGEAAFIQVVGDVELGPGEDKALTEEHLVAAVTAAANDIVPGLG